MLEQLKNIGLSDNEAKVYMAMLELGPSSVADIAKKANINRPTAYVQIESLQKQGLVSTQTKGKKQLYIAESPELLQDIVDRKMRELSVSKAGLGDILPQLNSLYQSAGYRPTVRFFEGSEGLLQMQNILLKSGIDGVLGITALDDLLGIFPAHQSDYSKRRIEKKISSKLIYSSSKGPVLKDGDEAALRESRYIPPEQMPFSGDITIFGNSVMIISFKGQISGVVIEHKDIADSFRGLHRFLWSFSDQFSK